MIENLRSVDIILANATYLSNEEDDCNKKALISDIHL